MRDERELRRQAALAGRSWLLVKSYILSHHLQARPVWVNHENDQYSHKHNGSSSDLEDKSKEGERIDNFLSYFPI